MWQQSKLLLTDTDNSLIYEVKTEDVYENFSSNKKIFDFSDYSTKSKSQNTMMIHTNQSLEKWKMKPEALQLKNLSD